MTVELDCRGLACPAPVIQTKERVEKEHPARIKVTVDNEAAKQNVSRFLASQNYRIQVREEGVDIQVIGRAEADGSAPGEPPVQKPKAGIQKILVMITSDRMGYGDDELGKKLIVNFVNTLREMGEELWRLVLVNNGVKLTIEGSEVLPILKELEGEGIHILVCGTCLTHYHLLEEKRVGETTNMLDIVTSMQLADKVIHI